MPVEALFAAHAVFADALQVAQFVDGAVVTGGFVVMEVERDALEFHASLLYTAVVQAQSQFRIFVSPSFECLVESVDADEVPAPQPQVATSGRLRRRDHAVDDGHDGYAHAVVAVAHALGQRRQRGDLAAEDLLGQHFGDDAAGARNVAAFPGEEYVVLNEIALQDQVAVDMDDIVAGAGGDGLVADGCDPESPVFMPDVVHGNRRDVLEVPHDIAGADARSVVRNQDFGRHDGLLHHAVETQVKRPRPIVSSNDQRYSHRTGINWLGCRVRHCRFRKISVGILPESAVAIEAVEIIWQK